MADITADAILEKLGLQRQTSSADVVVPVVGAFLVGGLIGAGLALLFAPKAGAELRRDLGERVDEVLEGKDDVVAEYKKPNKNELRPAQTGAPQTGAPTARPSGF
jgi:hypothetical protein